MSIHYLKNIKSNDSSKKSKNKAMACLSLGVLASLAVVLGDQGKAEANLGSDTYTQTVSQESIGSELGTGLTSPYSKIKLYIHKVKPLDTLGKLAKRFNTSVSKIMYFNPQIKDKDVIIEGKDIYIPVLLELRDCGKQEVKTIHAKKYKERKDIGGSSLKILSKNSKKRPNGYVQENSVDDIFTKDTIESIISDRDNFTIFHEYGKLYHGKKVQKILRSEDPMQTKKKKIVGLFLTDNKIFGKKTVIKQINNLKFGNRITQKIDDIFSKAGYNIKPSQIVEMYAKVETSGGNYNYYLYKAGKEKDQRKQQELLNKAVNCAVGPAGDSGPFQITGPWLETEKKHGATIEGNYIKNSDTLKRKVYMVFKSAVINGYSIEQVGKVLAKVDIRFDIREMSKTILFSFERLHTKYSNLGSLSEGEIIRLCTLAYNSGEGRANVIAKRIIDKKASGLKGLNTKDNQKRSNLIEHASLQNNLQRQMRASVKTDDYSEKIVSLADRVKTHTAKIVNPEQRKIVENKLKHDPVGKLVRAEKRFGAKGLRNIIDDIQEDRKVA